MHGFVRQVVFSRQLNVSGGGEMCHSLWTEISQIELTSGLSSIGIRWDSIQFKVYWSCSGTCAPGTMLEAKRRKNEILRKG